MISKWKSAMKTIEIDWIASLIWCKWVHSFIAKTIQNPESFLLLQKSNSNENWHVGSGAQRRYFRDSFARAVHKLTGHWQCFGDFAMQYSEFYESWHTKQRLRFNCATYRGCFASYWSLRCILFTYFFNELDCATGSDAITLDRKLRSIKWIVITGSEKPKKTL